MAVRGEGGANLLGGDEEIFPAGDTVLTGVDLVEIERFRKALTRHPGLEERLFTEAEREDAHRKADFVRSLAVRFAAKEAVGKLLGTGVISWRQIEILPGPPPLVRLLGKTAGVAALRGVYDVRISLSHTASIAAATATALYAAPGASLRGQPPPATTGDPDTSGAAGRDSRLLALEERPEAFTAAQIRALDRLTIEELGLPGPVLMERAALGVTELVRERYPGRHTLIMCGRGNNGGDGLAAARQLHLAGHPVVCVVLARSSEELSPDAALNFRLAENMGVNLRLGSVPSYLWGETELVIDCLLGTGATGELREGYAEWAHQINRLGERGVPVVAVDIPSGVDATTGEIAQGAVAASATVTFHAAKSGLVCPPGSEAAGEVLVWDIGLPRFLEPRLPDVRVVTAQEVVIPGRRSDDHKYRAGYVLVVAGSYAFPGAAYLACAGALRTGAGYVRLATPASAAPLLPSDLPELVVEKIAGSDFLEDGEQLAGLAADGRIGALVVGPGLGRSPNTPAAVRRVLGAATAPAVLDADGLLVFAGRASELSEFQPLVLTPHAGELAILLDMDLGEIARSALIAARRAAEVTGQTVVLKGSSTIISQGKEAWVVTQGPPQLASAGTGDVLSGCIGALLAKGMAPLDAARAGVWLHAEAGRLGAELHREGVGASDVIDLLSAALAGRIKERRPAWTS